MRKQLIWSIILEFKGKNKPDFTTQDVIRAFQDVIRAFRKEIDCT